MKKEITILMKISNKKQTLTNNRLLQTTDSADFLATRAHTAAVIPGKPAANPLQFVRVGPADLGSRAREQLRRAELAKRTEPRIEIQEEWQSVSSDPMIKH
jgi:hypothetical protein